MSDNVFLPNSNVLTSRLGFGCAYLTGGLELKKNLRLIDAAYDSGIRHFDVAPLYGIGTAENVLAKAIGSRRSSVTIASKVGRPRPVLTFKMQLIRWIATPIRRYASFILRHREKKTMQGQVSQGRFDLPFVQKSINETLNALNTSYLDVLFLHEAMSEDITDELLTFLDKQRIAGVFKSVGVASTYEKLVDFSTAQKEFFDVFQYSWSVLDVSQKTISADKFVITHRAIMRAYEPLHNWIGCNPNIARRLSNMVGADLLDPQMLPNILLGAALYNNSKGITLVGTRRLDRVFENSRVLTDHSFVDFGGLLIKALESERSIPIAV